MKPIIIATATMMKQHHMIKSN